MNFSLEPVRAVIGYLFFLFLISISNGCKDAKGRQGLSISPSPQLIIIGQDISLTFKDFHRTAPEDLNSFLHELSEAGLGSATYFTSIGNPGKHHFEKCLLEKAPASKNNSLSGQQFAATQKKRTEESNDEQVRRFINVYLSEELEKNHDQYTDLEHFFKKVNEVANEPRYANYTKTVFLFSDGHHSVPKKEGVDQLSPSDFLDIKFYTCGLKNRELFGDIEFTEVESPSAFFENFFFKFKSYQ